MRKVVLDYERSVAHTKHIRDERQSRSRGDMVEHVTGEDNIKFPILKREMQSVIGLKINGCSRMQPIYHIDAPDYLQGEELFHRRRHEAISGTKIQHPLTAGRQESGYGLKKPQFVMRSKVAMHLQTLPKKSLYLCSFGEPFGKWQSLNGFYFHYCKRSERR